MKPKSYDCLIFPILSEGAGYFPRKQPDQLCVVADTTNSKIYPVPIAIEHVDFVSELLGCHITEDLLGASRFVPSNIIIRLKGANGVIDNKVMEIITGVSGMEIGYNLRHTPGQLQKAHGLANTFVVSGEIPQDEEFKSRIIRKYSI